MCVASYGVMPHAYSVATGPAAARTSSPDAVSYSRGAGPLPGSTGTSTRRQESMLSRLSRAAPWAAGAGAVRCCGEKQDRVEPEVEPGARRDPASARGAGDRTGRGGGHTAMVSRAAKARLGARVGI